MVFDHCRDHYVFHGMKYTNLLGEEIDTDVERKKLLKVNPMVKVHGTGPEGKRCKHCTHFIIKQWGNRYFKCAFRGNTNGPGTDHRANYPTCGKFESSIPL